MSATFDVLKAVVGEKLADLIDPAALDNPEILADVDDALRGMVEAEAAGDAANAAAARRRLKLAAQRKLTEADELRWELFGLALDTALLFAAHVTTGGLAALAAALRAEGD
jgi:hypothetical protein